MKKLIYLIMGLGLLFTACSPMDDIYADIDAQETAIEGHAEYTLTDEDYTDLELNGGFESVDDVKTMVPNFLTGLYPVWGKGSTVLVNYNMIGGLTDLGEINDYINADTYSFKNEDYPGYNQNAFAFFPDEDPLDYLGNILPTVEEGEIILVKYNQYVSEPVTGIVNYFDADFKTSGTLLDFDAISIVGDEIWVESNYGAKVSGYVWPNSLPNEDWLISKEIDLTSQTNISFQISQIINKSTQLDLLNILVSTDYNGLGDPSTATWGAIDLTTKPAGTSWTAVLSEDYDFSAYEGKKIHVAFKYESTTTTAATWEVENMVIKTPGVEGETEYKEIYYKYNGSEWEIVNGVYYLSSDDYDSMGTASGQPGKYNNFDSGIAPSNYIPAFLGLAHPFAQEEDALIVMYKYYISGTGTRVRGNLYTVVDGMWTAHSSSLQFGHDGNSWLPDNTIKYTLVNADYEYISAQLSSDPDYADLWKDLGDYHDFSYTWKDANDSYDLKIGHALAILAAHLNPTAEEGQKYVFTYLLYDNGTNYVNMPLILTSGVWIINK